MVIIATPFSPEMSQLSLDVNMQWPRLVRKTLQRIQKMSRHPRVSRHGWIICETNRSIASYLQLDAAPGAGFGLLFGSVFDASASLR